MFPFFHSFEVTTRVGQRCIMLPLEATLRQWKYYYKVIYLCLIKWTKKGWVNTFYFVFCRQIYLAHATWFILVNRQDDMFVEQCCCSVNQKYFLNWICCLQSRPYWSKSSPSQVRLSFSPHCSTCSTLSAPFGFTFFIFIMLPDILREVNTNYKMVP